MILQGGGTSRRKTEAIRALKTFDSSQIVVFLVVGANPTLAIITTQKTFPMRERLFLCQNISEVIVLDNNPKCDLYDPRDKTAKPNCPNCYLWLGVACEEHLMLVKKHMTARKFESIDRMMRGNRGVWIG